MNNPQLTKTATKITVLEAPKAAIAKAETKPKRKTTTKRKKLAELPFDELIKMALKRDK